jgi:uncharacterized protein (DUF58 family)
MSDSPLQSLDPAWLSKLGGLELRAKAIVDGWLAGRHRSRARGSSIEFAEHREYSPGDDPRSIDWKVYGKRDRLQVKQYEAESSLRFVALVDASGSMDYRSQRAVWSKGDCARTVAAALVHLVLQQQDAAGCGLFDQELGNVLRPARGGSQWGATIEILSGAVRNGSEAKPATFAALHEAAGRLPLRCVIAVVSDCLGPVEELRSGLKHLRHAGHDLIVIQIVDPAEEEFPFERLTEFRGLETVEIETIDPAAIRAVYREEFRTHCLAVERTSRDLGCDYLRLRTDGPVNARLAEFLSRR